MMKISKIEKSKHRQERVLVYTEEGDLLRVTGAELLRFNLYSGMDLSDELVVELQKAARQSENRQRAARIASSRMLSRQEMQERLTKKGASEEEAAELTDWLTELGAVDDAVYAGTVARHYAAMGYGAEKVRQELHRRGIPRELWEAALAELPPAEESIEQYIRSKWRGDFFDRAAVKKLSDALLRRGFAWKEIRPVLNRLGEEIEEDE